MESPDHRAHHKRTAIIRLNRGDSLQEPSCRVSKQKKKDKNKNNAAVYLLDDPGRSATIIMRFVMTSALLPLLLRGIG
jgi:hypothetical protein